MNIMWHGGTSFSLENDTTQVVIDPIQGKTTHDICLFTSEQTMSQDTHTFDWPGEYEVGGIGWTAMNQSRENGDENLMYLFDIEHMKIFHLGMLDSNLEEDQLKEIGDVDILCVPLGGNDSINAKKAAILVEKIEPRIVIPMLFDDSQLHEFQKEIGADQIETVDTLQMKKSQLPTDDTRYVVLKKQ